MPRQSSGAAARIEYSLFAAGRAALKALPLPRAASLGVCLGSITAAVDRINRPVAMRNLEIAFPQWAPAQRLATLTAMYRNWGRMAAEWCHLDELTPDNISQFAHYEGVENWRRGLELSDGHGGFIFSGHFGSFELLMVAHALFGHPVAIVHRPLRNPLIDAVAFRARTRAGNHMIPRKGAAKEMFAIVRRAGVVAIPIDLDVRRGVFVDFFSLKACTTTSLARLAIATGTPAVPGFMVREGTTLHHRMVILPPLDIVREGDHDEAVRETTQRATHVVEKMIRQYPDHWNWIHRRWKTRPPGEKRFY
ncbi:MAG TPA: lysophospholipid acyltransferase family protein [Candidatus Binataceae bacterium]|jgi:KDO2-lipid IV(A) lauroyltransferase|nr:lysophospholipid acyltransferase family protein [Candidatus Binataceae bacterium]